MDQLSRERDMAYIVLITIIIAAALPALFVSLFILGVIFNPWFPKDLSRAVKTTWHYFWRSPRNDWIEWRCKRARKYLTAHDFNFRMQEVGNEVVRRRQKFFAEGGKPLDANCPDHFDVLDDWGFSPPDFRR